jgi:urease subunit gamma
LILIKVTIKGEPDVSPIIKLFHYLKTDEEIFVNSVNMIQDKLNRNLKININEAIVVYSAFIVSELRNGKSIEYIQNNASCILNPEQVMIGVPESMRKISFEVTLDGNSMKMVVLNLPIQTLDYVLKST